MSSELKAFKKPQKMKIAQNHLCKYVGELKRHFEFSDFQVIKLLENSTQQMKDNCKEQIISRFLSIFSFANLIEKEKEINIENIGRNRHHQNSKEV